jgi:biotin transport system substrate-specific component
MSDAAALRRRPLVLADLLPGTIVRDVLLVAAAAGLVGLLAQVSIPLPFTPVPVTGQTLGVLLAGTALGWRRAGLSLVLYTLAGLAGVPWFAGHTSGYQHVSMTFGYIIGFVAASVLCGYLAEREADRNLLRSLPAMLAGEVAIYAFGLPWLAVTAHLGVSATLAAGFTPFIIGDAIKAAIAAGLLPAAWRLAGRRDASAGAA